MHVKSNNVTTHCGTAGLTMLGPVCAQLGAAVRKGTPRDHQIQGNRGLDHLTSETPSKSTVL
jgi:hypothetical protein